jgi:hypothetical protein
MSDIDPVEARRWMNANRRGYAAAAEHFGVGEAELREACKGVGPGGAPTRAREREGGEPEPPPTLPAIVPAKPVTEMTALEFYRHALEDLATIAKQAGPRDAPSIFRRMQQYREKFDELVAEDAAGGRSSLTPEQRRAKLATDAERMSDALLEVFVKVYLGRHKLKLVGA